MATGWNAPQGVENVHTLCAGKPESDDRGNNISVKRLGTSLDRCIERYIKKQIIIIIIHKVGKDSSPGIFVSINHLVSPLVLPFSLIYTLNAL